MIHSVLFDYINNNIHYDICKTNNACIFYFACIFKPGGDSYEIKQKLENTGCILQDIVTRAIAHRQKLPV
jgi:hypothetical protein